jgi:hypothetical protein
MKKVHATATVCVSYGVTVLRCYNVTVLVRYYGDTVSGLGEAMHFSVQI